MVNWQTWPLFLPSLLLDFLHGCQWHHGLVRGLPPFSLFSFFAWREGREGREGLWTLSGWVDGGFSCFFLFLFLSLLVPSWHFADGEIRGTMNKGTDMLG